MNLTPRTYLLAALTALLGIVEQWAAAVPFPLWRLAAGLMVAALLYEWLWARSAGLRIHVQSHGPLALGREELVPLTFHNPGHRALVVMFEPALPDGVEYSAGARRLSVDGAATTTTAVPARPTILGGHPWPWMPVRILGPLGLGWWSHRCRLDAVIDVVPDILRTRTQTQGSTARGSSARVLVGTGSELHHLREYRPGDPRHTIDWKATARSGTLITRVYGEDQHLEVVLVVDAGRTGSTRLGGLSQLGHFVNAAARFAEHAAAVEDRVGIVAVSDRLLASAPPGRGLPGVLRIRRTLAALQPQPVETDLLRAALEVQRLVRHRALVIVLTDLYGQDTGGRLAQSIRLLQPRHLPVVVGLVGEEIDRLTHRPARSWIDPYESLAAREFRTRVWRNAQGLRRQGAQTLVTTPEALDARVLSLYQTLRAQRRV